jgi:fatty-acyl-CoA synthase
MAAEPMARLIAAERVTASAAVPTIWAELLRFAEHNEVDFSSVRRIACGGAAVPRALMEAFRDRFDIRLLQAWGMTETSPIAASSVPPKGVDPDSDEGMGWRALTGRVIPGCEVRIVDDDGTVLPWDGDAVGEIQIRGPWITASYYGDPSPEKFDDGWLRTGDIASVTPNGYLRITDRSKDVIKSGGEWISSVELEGLLMAHPAVAEAAVIAVPDPKWTERPLACVVLKEGASATMAELRDFLGARVAKWQVPERWSIIAEVPKTSVGKFDKKVLRARYADGELAVDELS